MNVAHPRGKTQSNDINGKQRLTGTLCPTPFRGVQSAMANPSGAPPGPESENPRRANGEGLGCHCSDTEALTKFLTHYQPPRIIRVHWFRPGDVL